MAADMSAEQKSTYNVNVGVLGHVDSGKTSLVAALSTTLSTAALDKHPQSKERGITLDLGFSSFTVPAPPQIQAAGYSHVQFTLVDCPGHASLIRTIIGGAQIIDLMVLVVDATRGIQTQTAECIVIGEVAAADMVVALNKTDLFPDDKRERYCRKARKLVATTLAATKFAGCPIVPVAARPGAAAAGGGGEGGGETANGGGSSAAGAAVGVQGLVDVLLSRVQLRGCGAGSGGIGGSSSNNGGGSSSGSAGSSMRAAARDPFLFYVDHCFAIKGQGTVLTGTVMRGGLRVGDTLELPELRVQKKVKSMQMFRQPVQACSRGDRVGICVTQLDAKLVERGLACTPGSVPTFEAAVAAVEKIRFYSGDVRSRSKMHVTVGHTTVMADLLFFGLPDGEDDPAGQAALSLPQRLAQLTLQRRQRRQQQQHDAGAAASEQSAFDSSRQYLYQEELYGPEGRPASEDAVQSSTALAAAGQHPADQQPQQHGQVQEYGVGSAEEQQPAHLGPQWVYLRFSQPVTAAADSLVIGAKLDADLHTSQCRLAFYGQLCTLADPADQQQLRRLLPVYKRKQREGTVERVEADGCTAVCRGMFQKETDLGLFAGMRVTAAPGGQEGRIEGGFGKSGKFKVYFPGGAPRQQQGQPPARVVLRFKRFLFDSDKRRMVQ